MPRWIALAFFFVTLLVPGCKRHTVQAPENKPPEVSVAYPVLQEITDFQDFAGRTDAAVAVEIRSRVTGYLDRIHFKEGTDIQKGDPLFEIDPRQYLAEVDRTKAELERTEVRHKRLLADYDRGKALLASRASSQEDFDKIAGDVGEASAAIAVAKSNKELAQLRLTYTKLSAPISGRIGRQLVDPGNLVKADESILTTIVSIDPIHAYFNVDERTLLRLRRLMQQGKAEMSGSAHVKVRLGLADEKDHPHEGFIDFTDNKVDAGTGTLRVRAVFNNENGLLSAGLFVRVRIPIGNPHPALLIPEQALGTDQGQKFVYLVNGENRIVYRKVRAGSLIQGMREIEEGIRDDERVVVAGLPRVRPGIEVRASLAEPRLGEAKKPALQTTSR